MKINGAALTDFRELHGMSQLALAAKSGVSQGRISEIEKAAEKGEPLEVRPDTARKLAEALGCRLPAIVIPQKSEAA